MALSLKDLRDDGLRTSRLPRRYDSETGLAPDERARLERATATTIARLGGDAVEQLAVPLGGAEAAVDALVANFNAAVLSIRDTYVARHRDLLKRGRMASVSHTDLAEDEQALDRSTIEAFAAARDSALAKLDTLEQAARTTVEQWNARCGNSPDLETAAARAVEGTAGNLDRWQRELNLRLQATGPRAADMRAVVERFAREYVGGSNPSGVSQHEWGTSARERGTALADYVVKVRAMDGGPAVVAAHDLIDVPAGGSALTRQSLIDRGRSDVRRLIAVIEKVAIKDKPATASPAPNPRAA